MAVVVNIDGTFVVVEVSGVTVVAGFALAVADVAAAVVSARGICEFHFRSGCRYVVTTYKLTAVHFPTLIRSSRVMLWAHGCESMRKVHTKILSGKKKERKKERSQTEKKMCAADAFRVIIYMLCTPKKFRASECPAL